MLFIKTLKALQFAFIPPLFLSLAVLLKAFLTHTPLAPSKAVILDVYPIYPDSRENNHSEVT